MLLGICTFRKEHSSIFSFFFFFFFFFFDLFFVFFLCSENIKKSIKSINKKTCEQKHKQITKNNRKELKTKKNIKNTIVRSFMLPCGTFRWESFLSDAGRTLSFYVSKPSPPKPCRVQLWNPRTALREATFGTVRALQAATFGTPLIQNMPLTPPARATSIKWESHSAIYIYIYLLLFFFLCVSASNIVS